jgi:hypothetical protein
MSDRKHQIDNEIESKRKKKEFTKVVKLHIFEKIILF